MRIKTLLLAASMIAVPAMAAAPIAGVKNIIIIVNDGGGPTVYDATRYYLGHPLVTDGASFKKTFVSTFPLRPDSPTNNTPGSLVQDPSTVYSTTSFWNTTPVAGLSTATGYNSPAFSQAGFAPIPGPLYPAAFQGYEFSRFAHPDSGNTATSLASGVKTYNNAINVNGHGDPAITITDLIDAAVTVGKSTGVVSTVEFADATPAALGGAHNIARANRTAIAFEMFQSGKLDVIGGAGNPDYTDDSTLRPTPAYTWVSAPLWTDLKNNTNLSGGNGQKWKLVQDRASIQALANKTAGKPPKKLAMIVQSFTSTQFNRTNTVPGINATQDTVNGTPRKTTVPTQAEMTLAALNTLDANGRGFYLMSEAGAVDRAEHANDTARMIEEQIESDNAVQAVIDWVNRPDTAATWDNTLLIVTADHDHLLYGPQGDTVPFQPIKDNGAGVVPGNKWFGPNHGTGLVPLFAYGKGAADLVALATNVDDTGVDLIDPATNQPYHLGHGAYLDQTLVGETLKATAQQAQ